MKKEVSGGNISATSIEKLIDELASDPSITELSFTCNDPLNSVTAKILMDYLKTNNTVKSLQFSSKDNPGDKITAELGEMLKVNTALESLIYRDGSTIAGSYSRVGIGEALKVNTTLTTLYIDSATGIGESLGFNKTLTKLVIDNLTEEVARGLKFNEGLTSVSFSGLKDGVVETLADALTTNTTIKTLSLGTKYGGSLTQTSGLKLAEGLKANTSVENLGLSWFGGSAIASIALLLKDTNITTLNINGFVGSLAAKNIAIALKDNCALKSLRLDYQANIGLEGYEAIAEALITNNVLESISIPNAGNGGVMMGDIGGKMLENILKSTQTLKTIDFYSQQITPKDAKAFGQGLEANNSLATLNLGYNRLGSKEGEETYFFSKALVSNISLIDLNLSGNNLQLLDSQQVGKALKVNKELKVLNLSSNGELKDPGIKNIIDALYSNDTLTSLDVTRCNSTAKSFEETAIVLKDNKTIKTLGLDASLPHGYGNKDFNINNWDNKIAKLIKTYLDRNNNLASKGDEEKQEQGKQEAGKPEVPLQYPVLVPHSDSRNQAESKPQPHRPEEEEKENDPINP